MSRENVEVVRRLFEAWNVGDMDAFRELYHPDAVLRMREDWPEPGPYFGRDAIMREFEQLRETWDGRDRVEPIGDFIDVGDRVLMRHTWGGRGQGPEAAVELTAIWTVRNASKPRGCGSKAMSQNVETVRQCFERSQRADYRAALAYFDPAVETVEPDEMPGAATYVGYEGLVAAFAHFADAWEGYTVELEELTAAGGNQVVANAKYHAIGRESGVPVETRVSHVYDFAACRIVRWRMFNSGAEALEAVGLSPQAGDNPDPRA